MTSRPRSNLPTSRQIKSMAPGGGRCQFFQLRTLPVNDISVIHLIGKRGGFTVVDTELLERLSKFKWKLDKEGYVSRWWMDSSRKQHAEYLHIVVNGTPKGLQTDHRNGYKIDNTRRNLRTCTNAQNHANIAKQQTGTSSRWKGVSWHRHSGKWRAHITVNQRHKHLGVFHDERSAAQAYNTAAVKFFGDFAHLNSL